jgi:orotate phosphoribosyltransferase
MIDALLSALPVRQGHFRLESGLHTDLWLTLDALFVSPGDLAPLTNALADRLRPHRVSAVCGPLLGGAFLAQGLASVLGVNFYFSEPVTASGSPGLFGAEYQVPAAVRPRLSGERIALVDDVISAGSSVRATAKALSHAGASIVAVGALLVLGTVGLAHFAGLNLPVEALGRRDLALWNPAECPLCRAEVPLTDPV